MLTGTTIVVASFLYLLLLFAVAYVGDKRADAGRSIIANPTIYALSLAVYCTTWTYYGSVGRAASSGLGFVPIFLGPTLVVALVDRNTPAQVRERKCLLAVATVSGANEVEQRLVLCNGHRPPITKSPSHRGKIAPEHSYFADIRLSHLRNV